MTLIVCWLLLTAGLSHAQQSRFAVTDSLAITTTAIDSTFTYPWESVVLWTSGCNALYKIEINAVDDITGEPYFRLDAGSFVAIKKDQQLGISGLYRLRIKAVSGTGTVYLFGTKKTDG